MFELINQGGPVVWVVFSMGFVAFVVFIERALYLHRARIKSEDFLKGIFNILKRNNISEAIAICEDTPGPIPHVLKTAILHRHDRKEAIQTAVDDAGVLEVSRMERRLVVVATAAQLAPLLGLLGTVIGMVEALVSLQAQAGLVQSADVMGGMMMALISTAAGLTVAIPCYAAFNLLVVKIDRIVLDMERAGSETVAFLTGSWTDQNGRSQNDSGKNN
jgi:biopolymer transport protein ExbB